MERWWSIIKAANIKTEKVELPAIPGGLLPPSVIASASEAIHQDKRGQSGLLRRFASRNDARMTARSSQASEGSGPRQPPAASAYPESSSSSR
jgi:hypothetical protein